MQRKKGTATEAEDTKFNRRQLLLQPLVMAKVADIDLAGVQRGLLILILPVLRQLRIFFRTVLRRLLV